MARHIEDHRVGHLRKVGRQMRQQGQLDAARSCFPSGDEHKTLIERDQHGADTSITRRPAYSGRPTADIPISELC